jgi:hypothetical protein
MTQAARERLRELRARPHNFLSRAQASEGHHLAFEVLDELHANRRLPSFAELEEVATNPHARQGFLDWCQRTRRFALWTQESVVALADHLREAGFARIVELGAGRGHLAWHLTRMGVPVEATDAGAALYATYTLSEYLALPVDMWENVRPLHYRAALASLRPDCVLCAWMPPDEDWTPEIRSAASVREYVLFWELRGTTGGRSAFAANPGWRPRDLIDVEEHLVGRTDDGLPHIGLTQYTRATAFLRVEG